MYEYKVTSSTIATEKNETFEPAMEKLFNLEDLSGWRFYTTITNTEIVPPGCSATLLFGKSSAAQQLVPGNLLFLDTNARPNSNLCTQKSWPS